MTERLYYDDAYLLSFDATVTASSENADGSCILYLDRSAFYPTSGGQPYDTGTINTASVTDVYVDENGDVAHKTDAFIPAGTSVHCEIDSARRTDHMQQHAGEHILAGCVWRELHGHTTGLHLGHDSSSIDVDFPDGRTHLTDAEVKMLEDEVNKRIWADVPIKCWFPEPEELSSLPLRKPPTVKEHVRVVQIGDDEFCACGGTHPSSAGQIGLIRILDARPSRGKVRITFLCGKRAFEYLRTCHDALNEVDRLTSSTPETAVQSIETLISRLKDAEYRLVSERTAAALKNLDAVYDAAETVNGIKLVKHIFEGLDFDGMTKGAAQLIEKPGTVVLFANTNTDQSLLFLFARSGDVTLNMSSIMKECGARGGGKPDFARGSAKELSLLDSAYDICKGGIQ